MFTVKQETGNGDKMWPGINHVYTAPMHHGRIDAVYALFETGGDLQFIASANRHVIYVMNEAGATVALYDLGYRAGLPSAGAPPEGAMQVDISADNQLSQIAA